MEIPPGAEKFTFPYPPRPSSPPATPASSQSRQSSISHISPIFSKRNGFIGPGYLGYSPPENIDPTGLCYQFSYTPPQREISSESLSDSEDNTVSDDKEPEAEVESHSEIAASTRRKSIHIRHVDDQTDITVEEMSENDMDYDSDTEAVQPDHIEDAESEIGRQRTPEVDHALADKLNGLNWDESPGRKEFEEAQQSRRERRKKRWSKGGSHKRSHAESVGMDSDNDDVEPLDAHQVGSSARRLRRRTQGPDDKPRNSLLFDDPPEELEELKGFTDDSDDTDDEDALPVNHNNSEKTLEQPEIIDIETTFQSADEEEVPLPYWRYPMEIDSDPNRPSSPSVQRHQC